MDSQEQEKHGCEETETSIAMARIHVPKKGTFTCDSNTAEEAVEYLKQVPPGKFQVFQMPKLVWERSCWGSQLFSPDVVKINIINRHSPRLDEPWHGNVLLSCGPQKLEATRQLREFNADFEPRLRFILPTTGFCFEEFGGRRLRLKSFALVQELEMNHNKSMEFVATLDVYH